MAYRVRNISSSDVAIEGNTLHPGDYTDVAQSSSDLAALVGQGIITLTLIVPAISTTTVSEDLTATGADDPVQLPAGTKSFFASVEGTGAVVADIDIEASVDGVTYVALTTIELSDTDADYGVYTSTDAWTYHRANVTTLTGTEATVNVTVSM